jgi:hypothetical protein
MGGDGSIGIGSDTGEVYAAGFIHGAHARRMRLRPAAIGH